MADLVDTSDLTAFAAELHAAPAKVAAAAPAVVERSADEVAAAARAAAPKDRPWLSTEEGITVTAGDDPMTREVSTGLDPRGNPVGLYQEFGTKNMAPQPFLLPQADRGAEAVEDGIADIAVRVLR